MKKVRVGMHKMGASNEPFSHFFSKFPEIFERFNIVQVDKNPDVLFCGNTPPRGDLKKVFYTNEAFGPVLNDVEWSFSTQPEKHFGNLRYMRQPYYVRIGGGEDLIQPTDYAARLDFSNKTNFCNYVYSHSVSIRVLLFRELSKYKKVDAPGSCCTNTTPIGSYATAEESRFNATADGSNHRSKLAYIAPYKFTIAFENTCFDGYTSEKIYQAMLVNSIPVFWGNPYIAEDFNTRSFINAHDCPSNRAKDIVDYVVSRIIELDKDDDKYMAMLQEPWLPGNRITPVADRTRIINRFIEIFSPEEVPMERKSYSQNGEDTVLWKLFETKETPGVFIDVGSHDGLVLSNTLSFEQAGWQGLCVEAHPTYAKACMTNRRAVCVHAAVGATDLDAVTFYTTNMGHLSTLDKGMEDYYKAAYKRHFVGFNEVRVPQRTLDTMIERCGFSEIDFISIDVEGSELNVLRGLNLSKYRPRVILAEAMQRHNEQELKDYLSPYGYFYACKTGNNLFFCTTEADAAILRGPRKTIK